MLACLAGFRPLLVQHQCSSRQQGLGVQVWEEAQQQRRRVWQQGLLRGCQQQQHPQRRARILLLLLLLPCSRLCMPCSAAAQVLIPMSRTPLLLHIMHMAALMWRLLLLETTAAMVSWYCVCHQMPAFHQPPGVCCPKRKQTLCQRAAGGAAWASSPSAAPLPLLVPEVHMQQQHQQVVSGAWLLPYPAMLGPLLGQLPVQDRQHTSTQELPPLLLLPLPE